METTEAEKPKAKRMVLDTELQVMADINRGMSELEPEAVARVIRWLNSKYSDEPLSGSGLGGLG